jgi:hypothetical protein
MHSGGASASGALKLPRLRTKGELIKVGRDAANRPHGALPRPPPPPTQAASLAPSTDDPPPPHTHPASAKNKQKLPKKFPRRSRTCSTSC